MPPKKADRSGDELYGLPLGDFTHARDQLAGRLRKEGLRAEADAVKALRKPTAAAWALNQIARRRPKDVERLLAAGKRLRKAHQALLGGGGRAALEKASAGEREVVDRLTRDATAVAAEAGSTASANLDERIRNTLHAAALDEPTAAELAAGRLVREREAVGMFGAATAAPAPTGKARAADKRGGDTVPEQRRKAERALAGARAEETKAQREHAGAMKAVERAGKRADEAHRRADEARADLREAERREKEAARAHQRAAKAAAAAEKKLP